jgi:hypothetical protein
LTLGYLAEISKQRDCSIFSNLCPLIVSLLSGFVCAFIQTQILIFAFVKISYKYKYTNDKKSFKQC